MPLSYVLWNIVSYCISSRCTSMLVCVVDLLYGLQNTLLNIPSQKPQCYITMDYRCSKHIFVCKISAKDCDKAVWLWYYSPLVMVQVDPFNDLQKHNCVNLVILTS